MPCGLDALLCRFSVWCSCECSAEWCTISLVPNHAVPTGVFGTNQRRHPARRTQTEQYRICRDRTIWYEHNTYRPGARYGVRSSSGKLVMSGAGALPVIVYGPMQVLANAHRRDDVRAFCLCDRHLGIHVSNQQQQGVGVVLIEGRIKSVVSEVALSTTDPLLLHH